MLEWWNSIGLVGQIYALIAIPSTLVLVIQTIMLIFGFGGDDIDADGIDGSLHGVQDPGNLGTIIRTCDWFGIHDILCSHDTADCYNPKVVQATMGALARVRVHYMDDLTHILSRLQAAGYPIYGTLLDGQSIYQTNAIPDKSKGIIVMGNEGNGISISVRETITHPILIPSFPANIPTSESLNVSIATAIVLAEFRR